MTVVTTSPFWQTLVAQHRSQDPYGIYATWSDERLLQSYLLTKAQKRQIPLDQPVPPATRERITHFYNAVAQQIERHTGKLTQVVIALNAEGFGWAIVFSGRLLLVVRPLRDAQRFGFASFDQLVQAGEKEVQDALAWWSRFPAVVEV
ncbi:MAG: NifX-associated nitrogen fixation protein [Gloeomargarita sp. GMQP_bins_120]